MKYAGLLLSLLLIASADARTLDWMEDVPVDGFFVDRAANTCDVFQQVAVLGDVRSWVDPDPLVPGSSVCYRVQAFLGQDTSDYSNMVIWTEPGPPPPQNPTLTVSVVSPGGGPGGTVTSTPAGITCSTGATCAKAFTLNTVVTLKATVKGKASFVGWSGACSGAGTCVVTLTSNTQVQATFKK